MKTRSIHPKWKGKKAASRGGVALVTLSLVVLLALFPAIAPAATVTVMVGNGGFNFSPAFVTIQPGDTVQWVFSASGHSSTSGTPGSPTGVWDSGIRNQGATFSHTFDSAGSFPYFCTPHGACCGMKGTVTVSSPTPSPTPPALVQFANISTRLRVETGDNVLIGGFIITGTQQKRVIIRAIGPSLTQQGVPDALADPTLELRDSTQVIATNDNWNDNANRQDIIDSGLAPVNDSESAILTMLSPAAYTGIVRGVLNTTGVGLVEVYDLDRTVDSKLANISTRGFVSTADNVMIGGTIIAGSTSTNVLIRALGPSLTNAGVPNALQDPTLELHDGNGALLASNDNWRSEQETEILATNLAPTDDRESAILRNLPPGGYTAILSGANSTTGVALVEAYDLFGSRRDGVLKVAAALKADREQPQFTAKN